MPVGIDTEHFFRKKDIIKSNKEILFLSRISPNKKLDVLIEALKIVMDKNIEFHLSVVGMPLPKDNDYYLKIKNQVKNYNLEKQAEFFTEIPNYKTIEFYNKCGIFINLTDSGSYDKTIFEAMACESNIIVCNNNLRGYIPDNFLFVEDDSNDLAEKIISVLEISKEERADCSRSLRNYVVENHSLQLLAKKIINFL